jgi:4-carboxymuconolactone decarboxylase
MGKAFDFIHATNDVRTERGVRLPPDGQATTTPDTRGIGVPVRELITFAMLTALGGCDPQVRSHVAANLNVGSDRQTLIGVITVLLPFIGYPRTLNALAAINEVAPAAKSGLQAGAHGDLAQFR